MPLIETSKKFAAASTVIGLARIVRAETTFMKICWLLITLISFAFGLYLVSETIRDYLQYDVFTTIKIISSNSTVLPSVTFCFINPETKDLRSFFDKAFLIRNEKKNDYPVLIGEQFYDDNIGEWEAGDCIKFHHFTNQSETKLLIAKSLDEVFLFQINLNRSFDFIYVFLSDNYDNILDWSQLVASSYNVKGLYDIAFKKEVEIKLEEPYNHCQNVSDLTFRQSNCLVQCKNKNFVDKHNCTLGNYYSIPGYSICEKSISSSLEFDSVCEDKCPKECTTITFDTLINNPNMHPNSSNNLDIYVWSLDFDYIEINQTPKMSGYSLLNEIGGALGLFVGITCVSLFEFLEFFFELFLVFYK